MFAAAAGVVVAAGLIVFRLGQGVPASTAKPAHTATVPSSGPSPASSPSPGERPWPKLARAKGLVLLLPAREPEEVAYHQAYYPDALSMHPLGHLDRNFNKYGFEPPPDTAGVGYIVQASRGRGTGATTAVDIVMRKGTDVVSPVTGEVASAKHYKLYGRYPDYRVEIDPEGHSDLRVTIIHLTDVEVRRGDEVTAKVTLIGHPRKFPFHSKVNDYVPGGDPHVHIEVKERASARRPPKS